MNANDTVRSMKAADIVLQAGSTDLQVEQPARALLDMIGPVLLARGTEELRVVRIKRRGSRDPEQRTIIHLREFIRGREVIRGWVTVVLDEQTNEVILLKADFLPDRGLTHEPRLTAAEAKVKLEAELREIPYLAMNATLLETPARLAYTFEEWGSSGDSVGGALVWVFSVRYPPAGGEMHFGELNVDAVTGRIVPRGGGF